MTNIKCKYVTPSCRMGLTPSQTDEFGCYCDDKNYCGHHFSTNKDRVCRHFFFSHDEFETSVSKYDFQEYSGLKLRGKPIIYTDEIEFLSIDERIVIENWQMKEVTHG